MPLQSGSHPSLPSHFSPASASITPSPQNERAAVKTRLNRGFVPISLPVMVLHVGSISAFRKTLRLSAPHALKVARTLVAPVFAALNSAETGPQPLVIVTNGSATTTASRETGLCPEVSSAISFSPCTRNRPPEQTAPAWAGPGRPRHRMIDNTAPNPIAFSRGFIASPPASPQATLLFFVRSCAAAPGTEQLECRRTRARSAHQKLMPEARRRVPQDARASKRCCLLLAGRKFTWQLGLAE